MLYADQGNGTLFVQDSDANPGAVPPGMVGELAVTLPGANYVNLPAGYSFTAIGQSVTGPVTVTGGGSLFVGDQSTTYEGLASANTVLIAAGDGNDLIGLPTGTNYQVALGDGNDTVYANGSGTLTGGTGANLFFAGDPKGQNLVNSLGANDTVVAGEGSVTVQSYGADPMVYGGAGSLEYLGGSAGAPTIFGGTGTETVFGTAGQNITYEPGTNTAPDTDILAAGAGNETLNAGGADNGVAMAVGSGTVDIIGSTGDDVFFGGSGTATVTGNGGNDEYMFGDIPGHTGGTMTITDWNSNDLFATSGLGAAAAQGAVNAATVTGGNTIVRLPDNTTITFLDIDNPSLIQTKSF